MGCREALGWGAARHWDGVTRGTGMGREAQGLWGSALADDFDGAYVALADAQDEEAAFQQVGWAGNRVL
jgi:hypothetical protein